MIMDLFALMLERVPGITLLLILLLVTRNMVLRYLNASVAYGLWLLIPLYMLLPFDWLMSQSSAIEGLFTYRYNPIVTEYDAASTRLLSGYGNWFASIWFIGMIGYLAIYRIKYGLVKRSFTKFDNKLVKLDSQNIEVVNSSLIDFPAVVGFVNAYLILPKEFEGLSVDKKAMILEHEICHLHRQDFRWNILRIMVRSVFWFHPLVHFADKYVEADQEISCDLLVLHNATQTERHRYGEALVESATSTTNALLSHWDYFSLTKERVKMLKHYKQKNWHTMIAVLFAGIALLASGNLALAKSSKGEELKAASIINPRYPVEAAKAGIEGHVKFVLDVDSSGVPSNIKIIDSSPGDTFDQVALTAIEQWRFDVSEARKNVTYTMAFKLD